MYYRFSGRNPITKNEPPEIWRCGSCRGVGKNQDQCPNCGGALELDKELFLKLFKTEIKYHDKHFQR